MSNLKRRNLPGTKASSFCRWPEEPFESMDSTLAVQQLIQQSLRTDALSSLTALPETQDEGVWKYEHLRQFCMELNGLAVALQVGTLLCFDNLSRLRYVLANDSRTNALPTLARR